MNTVFYLAYLFATLVFGNFRIGPFSLRVYMNVIMAIYLLFSRSKRNNFKNAILTKFIIGYCIYVIITTFVLLINGEFVPYNFPKMLLANYFPSIVLIFATKRYAYNEVKMKNILAFLLILVTFNSIITIMQSFNSALGMQMANLFNNTTAAKENVDEVIGLSDKMVEKTGYGFASGIFNYAFTNGLYISAMGIFAFYFLRNERRGGVRIIYWIILLITLFACFFTQERISIVTMLLAVLFLVIYHGTSKKGLAPVFLLGIIALMFFVQNIIYSFNWGRTFQISLEGDSRSEIWPFAIGFIKDNFLLGGPIRYYSMTDLAPHNVFLNSFIISGAIGGFLICGIYIWLLFLAGKNIMNKKNDFCMVIVSLSVLIAFAYSLFHNASIHSGDSLMILLATMLLCQKSIMNVPKSNNNMSQSIGTTYL